MEDLYRILRTGHVQLQGIVDTLTDPVLVLDAGLCVEAASRSFLETFKVDRYETIGKPLQTLGDGQWDIPELHRLLLDVLPKATAIIDYEVEHEFAGLGRRTMLLTARTLFHRDNGSHSIMLSIVDATNQRHRDAAKDLLFDELRHRMNNLLAQVQAIARITVTEGRSAEEFRDIFLGRFGALVEAQELAYAEHGGASLQEVLERILAPYADNADAVVIGPGVPVALTPRTIMSLSLVVHELATNAAKYGAMSVPGGNIRVGWQVADANNSVRLTWEESGGPPAMPPSATGYGSKLIQSTIAYALRGQVEQKYGPGGLQVEIVFPSGTTSPRA